MAFNFQTFGAPVTEAQPKTGQFNFDSFGGEVSTKKKSSRGITLANVGQFASDVFKGITKPVVTLGVRPLQAISALQGATEEEQAVDLPYYGRIETSRGPSDVIKDIGRGIETVTLGVGGGAGKGLAQAGKQTTLQLMKRGGVQGAKIGGAFGFGQALEEGGAETTLQDIAKRTATGAGFGLGIGATIPAVSAGIRRLRAGPPTQVPTPPSPPGTPPPPPPPPGGAGGAPPPPPGAPPSLARSKAQEAVATVKHIASTAQEAAARSAERTRRIAVSPEHVKEAIRNNIDDQIIDFVQTANPADKAAFRTMKDMAKQAGKDLRFRERPVQVAGKQISEGYGGHLVRVKDVGVAQTNQVLNALPQKQIDASSIFLQFLKDLENKGITVIRRGNKAQMVSSGKVPTGDLGFYKEMYSLLLPNKKGITPKTFRNLHQLRQRIFTELSLARARQQPFSDDVAAYGDHLRKLLAEPINAASGNKYHAAQLKTAEALNALRDFVQILGYKGDLEKISTKDLRAGEVFSRVFGNASDRPTDVLQKLITTAEKYGYKGQGNVFDQLKFADLLENVYGTTQTRSLRGQVGRGALDAISETTGAAKDISTGNLLSLGTRTIKAILGRSEDQKVKAFEALVEGEAGSMGRVAGTVFGKKPPTPKLPKAPGAAATPKTAALEEWLKDDFWKSRIRSDAKEKLVPISDIGTNKKINVRQSRVTAQGLKIWIKRIESGERPSILVGIRPMGSREAVVLDGNHRLEAYNRLGFKKVPILDNTGGKL